MTQTFHEYPKIKRLGDADNSNLLTIPEDEIVVQEKIDGANFRFVITEDGPIFGSHHNDLDEETHNVKNWNKQWKKAVDFVREKLDGKDLSDYIGCIFYGETTTKHTVPYNQELIPPFLGFDILNKCNAWIDYFTTSAIFHFLDLPMVPKIGIWSAGDLPELTDDFIPKSEFYEGQAEGIVLKNYKRQIFAKKRSEAFLDKFGKKKSFAKKPTNDEMRIIKKFCPSERIEKQIFKLLRKGEDLGMALMGMKLPHNVYVDMVEEEWREILVKNSFIIDVRKLRKFVAQKCVIVLTAMIDDNIYTKEDEKDE